MNTVSSLGMECMGPLPMKQECLRFVKDFEGVGNGLTQIHDHGQKRENDGSVEEGNHDGVSQIYILGQDRERGYDGDPSI
jgi:hypothetical protein